MRSEVFEVVNKYVAEPLSHQVTNEILIAIHPCYVETISDVVGRLLQIAGDSNEKNTNKTCKCKTSKTTTKGSICAERVDNS